MALTLARSRTTRHLTLSHLLPNRLLSTTTPPPPLPSPSPSPLLNRPSLTPLSPTLRSLTSFLHSPRTLRSIHSSPGFRPLSPHLPVYQPQLSSTLSILNRFSAAILTVVVLGFYILYIKSGPICFTFNSFYQFLFYSSKLNLLILEVTALALAYHTYAGVRHLADDLGGFKNPKALPAAAFFLFVLLGFVFALDSVANFTHMEGGVGHGHKDNRAELSVKDSSKTT